MKRPRRIVAGTCARNYSKPIPALKLEAVARRAIARHDDRIDEMRQLSFDSLMAWHGKEPIE